MSDDLCARVQHLEKEYCRLKNRHRSFIVAAVAGISGLLFVGASENNSFDTLNAHQLLINDPDGKVRASIKASDEGVFLNFFSPDGTKRLVSGITSDGIVRQRLFDEKGRPRMSSAVFPSSLSNGAVVNILYGQEGKPVLAYTTDNGGNSKVVATSEKQDHSVVMSVSNNYAGFEVDLGNKVQATLQSTSGISSLQLYGGESNNRQINYVSSDGGSGTVLSDRNGTTRVEHVVTPAGGAFSQILDGRGQQKFATGLDESGNIVNFASQTATDQFVSALDWFLRAKGLIDMVSSGNQNQNQR